MANAISAKNQFVDAFPIAEDARLRPIQMMIGPVTTGGKNFITLPAPNAAKSAASIKYKKPALATPMQAYGSDCVAVSPKEPPISTTAK